MKDVIAKFEGDYKFLSNFYPSSIDFDAGDRIVNFYTAEAAFQACKYKAMVNASPLDVGNYIYSVSDTEDPNKANHLGRKVKIDTDKWDAIKVDCMRQVLMQKFLCSTESLTKQLLDTGSAMLVEGNSWNDTYWGRCEGKGKNKLGVLLMEIRGYCYWYMQYHKKISENKVNMGS